MTWRQIRLGDLREISLRRSPRPNSSRPNSPRRLVSAWWPALALALLTLVSTPHRVSAQSAKAGVASTDASPDSPSTGQIVLVAGAQGTEEYGEEFAQWVEQWQEVAKASETPMRLIGQDDEAGETDREQLKAAIDSLNGEESSPLWIVLIGHGTFTRGTAKFNLRGPDVSAKELAEWLKPVQRPVVVVNCASASGPFVNRLSGENRIIVSATKSGSEYNYARFGKFFARAIAAPDSDLDHDDEVSVHEAFLRASADVRAFYVEQERIATEHALLDDNGDGKGTPATMFRGTRANATAKDGSELDGKKAARITLAPAASRLPFTEAEIASRAGIERELDQLRQRKPVLDPGEYDRLLEPLMLQLAKIYQAAEQRQSPSELTD